MTALLCRLSACRKYEKYLMTENPHPDESCGLTNHSRRKKSVSSLNFKRNYEYQAAKFEEFFFLNIHMPTFSSAQKALKLPTPRLSPP